MCHFRIIVVCACLATAGSTAKDQVFSATAVRPVHQQELNEPSVDLLMEAFEHSNLENAAFDDVEEAVSSQEPGAYTMGSSQPSKMGFDSVSTLTLTMPKEMVPILLAILFYQCLRWALDEKKATGCNCEDPVAVSVTGWEKEMGQPSPFEVDEETDCLGRTKLHWAALNGAFDEVEGLLKGRACVDSREDWDETPLHFAARAGHTEVCGLLLAGGANVNALNADDNTPVVLAALSGQEATCELLVDNGAGMGGMADDELPASLRILLTRRLLTDLAGR